MSSEFLSVYVESAEEDYDILIQDYLKNPDFKNAERMSFYFRQFGSSSYLLTGNKGQYFNALHRSSGSYLFHLQNSNESNKQTSEKAPYFDAISAGLFDGARLMAEHASTHCNFDYEYEDDFLYTHFLLSYFFRRNSVSVDDCQKILEDYEKVLDGALETRFLICKAFYDKDADAFNENFISLLDERLQYINESIDKGIIAEDEWSWSKYISVEGLGLLKLASLLNFSTGNNYSQVPEALRTPIEMTFDPLLWKSSFK